MDWRRRKYYKVQISGYAPEQAIKEIKKTSGIKVHPFKSVEKQNDEAVERGFYHALISVPFHAVEQLENEFKRLNAGWGEIKQPEGSKEPTFQPDREFDFYSAWFYLNNHAAFVDKELGHNRFIECLFVEVVKVDPETKEINLKEKDKNTLTNVWLECGPYKEDDDTFSHDLDLDCGGDTFEEAIIKLAHNVKKYYNKDGTRKEC